MEELQPDLIFTHHPGDSHQAHQNVAKLTFAACRRNAVSLLLYERAFPGGITDSVFHPQWFEDISSTIEKKRQAVLQHKSQKVNEWVDSVVARARFWGQLIGVQYAEVFEVVKVINSREV